MTDERGSGFWRILSSQTVDRSKTKALVSLQGELTSQARLISLPVLLLLLELHFGDATTIIYYVVRGMV